MAGILVVVGTRPEAIKLAPVIDALRARGVSTRICATAQHRELLDEALGTHGFEPDIDLDLMRPNQSPGDLTGRMLSALDNVIATERPDCVIVQGDTATALAGAQAAYYRRTPIAHVEAGLRTGDLAAPHPEEGNRRMIGAIADLNFVPTAAAAEALAREDVPASKVYLTGNTVVDALLLMRRCLETEPVLAGSIPSLVAGLGDRRLVLVTCHRRESFAAASQIARALRILASRPDVVLALPLHPNPAIRQPLRDALADAPNAVLLEPLGFASFIALLSSAYLVLTDNGGVQEEAPILGVPALVMRDTTERPEGIDAGTARLVGTTTRRIVAEATLLLDNHELHARMSRAHCPYGDGQAGDRIAAILADRFGYADRAILAE